ncbi:hypothetical protein [Clostridium estertheticum]|uniref:hypothetical protein n=1 Tax=Clostridium estertheticum TaxID=238834 RepID=UPI001C7E1346|nr:hypothetical protein [Clostridium estertheticum]MBX4263620.1 hypothetical protein [Clostridium estertheticum]WLC87445.1 hypothetical protein KTC95_15070 [Clostridium estertheticum]
MRNMENNDKKHLKKIYKNFSDLVYVVATTELESFISKGEFTSFFNYRMKQMLSEIDEKSEILDAGVFFNTKGEITLIDAGVVGKFIENNYNLKMLGYYKNTFLNKIIRGVVNGSEKSKVDFILISYSILYDTLNELYKTISCKQVNKIIYINRYALEDYSKEDCTMVIVTLLILEDLCRYIGVDRHKMVNELKNKIYK